MTHSNEIWNCIKLNISDTNWIELNNVYGTVKVNLELDFEDEYPEAPGSNVPKWKRNVRNVLQYRKKTKQILWNNKGSYKLSLRNG